MVATFIASLFCLSLSPFKKKSVLRECLTYRDIGRKDWNVEVEEDHAGSRVPGREPHQPLLENTGKVRLLVGHTGKVGLLVGHTGKVGLLVGHTRKVGLPQVPILSHLRHQISSLIIPLSVHISNSEDGSHQDGGYSSCCYHKGQVEATNLKYK